MQITSWSGLTTNTSVLSVVIIITQLTKNVKYIKKIPTQLWSFILSYIILVLANLFTNKISISDLLLSLINAAIIALASNGGFDLLNEKFPGVFKKTDE